MAALRCNVISAKTEVRSIKLSEPAQRAFEEAGILTLKDVAQWSKRELMKLHGVGPKTIRTLLPLLEAIGLTIKP